MGTLPILLLWTLLTVISTKISLPEGQINIGLTPLQVSGSTSAGRVICGTDLAGCVSVPGDFLRPQGAFPPGFYLLREGWVHCPAPEAPLTRGMPKGPRVFLTNSGRVWATALRPVPPKKRPCAIHARKVGRASNTADHYRCYTNSTRLLTFVI